MASEATITAIKEAKLHFLQTVADLHKKELDEYLEEDGHKIRLEKIWMMARRKVYAHQETIDGGSGQLAFGSPPPGWNADHQSPPSTGGPHGSPTSASAVQQPSQPI